MAATSYPSDPSDWKGRFIHDLAARLDTTGRVQLDLWAPPGDLPGMVNSANSPGDTRWLRSLLDNGGIAHLLRRRPVAGLLRARGILARLRAACGRTPADIYHVHWMQLALGLPRDGKPAYVSVLGSDFGLLRLPGMTSLLRHAFRGRPTLLAPNTGWMSTELQARFGDVARIVPNPFGVDPAWFELQRAPSVPNKWLVVSRITRNKLGDLFDWGAGLFGNGRDLVLLGPMQETLALPPWIEAKGATNPAELRGQWFPQAAGMLTLSRHDEGRPQVLIEAMAAGMPVIASRIAAHTDLIRHGETGWIVDSQKELCEALLQAEDEETAARIGGAAREWVRERIGTWEDWARRCVDGYEMLLERAVPHGT
ncbi:glycosyltransferase family 4 protein [Pseudothauera rhizosphaerae]|uniref:Glycosyltransferase family 4 protein n=2 Tax=Pseudothauera rhizosphaerae TaxID=2565932 RepID=A0A4S4ABE2_9RHOO|nr:glycosyltransferase family 4 protein [Pseudothauera rhizosphaerae]